ncbi:MAG: hypothetical protein ACI9R3_004575 [Verrucomicrobiales bacterium]|jgi:hypothetical protein
MTLFLDKLPRCLVNHSKGRLLMILLIVVAAGLQWFCWSTRRPIIRQRQDEIRAIVRLEDDVKKLERRWSEEEAANVQERLIQTHDFLFTGSPASGGWSEEVGKPESQASMAVSVKLGKPKSHPRHSDDLTIAPTIWSLDLKKADHADLSALLTFIKDLTTGTAKRMDLVSLTVSGNGRELTSAELGLDLWFLNETQDSP